MDTQQTAALPPKSLPPMLHAPPLKTRKMLELPAPEPEVKKEPPAKAKAQASKLYKARPKIEPWILFLV